MAQHYKVGYVQNQPVFGRVKDNLAQAENVLMNLEADLVVLPELFSTGYRFTSHEEARELAEPIPGPTTDFLSDLARFKNMFLVAGLPEIDGAHIYNSALVTGPDGYLGKYRKLHLFDTEREVFEPGDLPLSVFHLGAARVGVMICFDWRFPETARTLALRGADIIAHPANLVLPHCPQSMVTRCLENRVFTVTADRVGEEARVAGEVQKFIGQSQVVDPDGTVLVRASGDQEESAVVEIDLGQARNKAINAANDLFHDRRTDLYKLA